MFDRAAILRDAHTATRQRMAPSYSQRYGDRYDATYGHWVPKAALTYRAIFAAKLRNAWHLARAIAESAALEASLPLVPADVLAAASALRADALAERITSTGNTLCCLKLSAAAAMIDVARYGAGLEARR